jgi:Zn-dependent peptidase ImmA (M78 family)
MIAIFPELSACAKAGHIEKLAILARSYFGRETSTKPKADLKTIFDSSGIQLQSMKMDAYGAVAVNDEKGRFRILAVYKETLEECEERFVLAHMLGHILLDIQPSIAEGQVGKLGYKEECSPLKRYSEGLEPVGVSSHQQAKEEMADHFAAALLMPEGMLRRAADKITQIEILAQFFGVSIAALERRLINLELVSGEPNSILDGEKKL